MPPKRVRVPAKVPPVKKAKAQSADPAKRPKRAVTQKSAAKAGDNGAHNDAEIMSAFRLFALPIQDVDDEADDDGEGVIKIADIRRCLSALNLPKPPSDFFDDPDQTYISSGEFLALAQTLRDSGSPAPSTPSDEDGEYASKDRHDEGQATEVSDAFSLFTHNRPGENVSITLADLKRVARELREDVDESTLRLMIEEANGEQGRESVGRGVGKGEFEEVMRRAGVIG